MFNSSYCESMPKNSNTRLKNTEFHVHCGLPVTSAQYLRSIGANRYKHRHRVAIPMAGLSSRTTGFCDPSEAFGDTESKLLGAFCIFKQSIFISSYMYPHGRPYFSSSVPPSVTLTHGHMNPISLVFG